ncbi:Heat induced stress protein YflT [compost metagenome]
MEVQVKIVSDEDQAYVHIHSFQQEGFTMHQIHVLANQDNTSTNREEIMVTYQVSPQEQVTVPVFNNLYQAQGEPLLLQMESLGLTRSEALQYEQALQYGGYLIIAMPDETDTYPLDIEYEKEIERGSFRYTPTW